MYTNIAISIIFICHNDEHIDICLDSVIEQTLSEDEIIVVDDNSNNMTLEVLNTYVAQKNILLVHSRKVANRSHNRNLGVGKAKNKIILFLDGDIVLGNDGLRAVRLAHQKREERAFIGNKHAINLDSYQLKLYAAIPNYLELLKTRNGRERLAKNPLFLDNRKNKFLDPNLQDYYWTSYYTGLCSVEREIFDIVDGFDESFTSWGSEDTDFAYRISKFCRIGFILDLHGFHIPHLRDVVKHEKSNRENILFMLKKYGSWEFEILLNIYGYGHLNDFEYIIQQMRMLKLSTKKPCITEQDILIDSISQDYPDGCIEYILNGHHYNKKCMGIAILVEKKLYKNAYISDHVFIYPQLLTCKIIQEALRIAQHVYIYPTEDNIRINWGDNMLQPGAQKQHYEYEVNDLLAFMFSPTDLGYIKVEYINGININREIY